MIVCRIDWNQLCVCKDGCCVLESVHINTCVNVYNRLKSGNACYHSVQNLLSCSLLFKSVKIKIYRTIILWVVLYGCETWSLTLMEECRLRVFENMVLRIFGPKRDKVMEVEKNTEQEALCSVLLTISYLGDQIDKT